MNLANLTAIEKILGGSVASYDAKSEHEKITANAKVKAKKLFGDAKERRYAKKKEKEKNGMHQSDKYQISPLNKNLQKHKR